MNKCTHIVFVLFYLFNVSFSLAVPFNPSCGSNAEYNAYNGIPYCSCPWDRAYGNPHVSCFECLYNSHCADNKACVKNTCTDPCQGKCGANAKCKTLNHEPQCTCLFGYTGNPDDKCSYIGKESDINERDPPPVQMIYISKTKGSGISVTIKCKKNKKGKRGTIQVLEICTATLRVNILCENNGTSCTSIFKKEGNDTETKYYCRFYDENGCKETSFETEVLGNKTISPARGSACNPIIKTSLEKNQHEYTASTKKNTEMMTETTESSFLLNEKITDEPDRNTKTESGISTSSLPVWQIVSISITVIIGVIAIVFFSVKLYRKCQEKKDLLYCYPTVPVMSHYATRALVTANKRLGEEDFLPSLPPRPRQKESDYDYADLPSLRK